MKTAIISPSILSGHVTLPPSKSAAHRAIICAALAKGKSVISPVELSDDIRATVLSIRALGADAELDGSSLIVNGTRTFDEPDAFLDCMESGSTLRFMIPIAAAGGVSATFNGRGRLPSRPLGIYLDTLPGRGAACETAGGLPLSITGKLQPGRFEIPGNVSSQFITGLLFALPLLPGDSQIVLTTALESSGYVDMTIEIMRDFGVTVGRTDDGYIVKGDQTYNPQPSYTVESDWSQAAFFLSAGTLGASLTLHGLRQTTTQGDRAAMALFQRFGADITVNDDESILVCPGKRLACDIDASQIPDLVPALAMTAALCGGTTTIYNAGRLRIKESDRLSATANAIGAMGGSCTVTGDGLIVTGVQRLTGGTVDGCNDHRIVMAATICSAFATAPVSITHANSIAKSYPSFFETFTALGGMVNVIDMG